MTAFVLQLISYSLCYRLSVRLRRRHVPIRRRVFLSVYTIPTILNRSEDSFLLTYGRLLVR